MDVLVLSSSRRMPGGSTLQSAVPKRDVSGTVADEIANGGTASERRRVLERLLLLLGHGGSAPGPETETGATARRRRLLLAYTGRLDRAGPGPAHGQYRVRRTLPRHRPRPSRHHPGWPDGRPAAVAAVRPAGLRARPSNPGWRPLHVASPVHRRGHDPRRPDGRCLGGLPVHHRASRAGITAVVRHPGQPCGPCDRSGDRRPRGERHRTGRGRHAGRAGRHAVECGDARRGRCRCHRARSRRNGDGRNDRAAAGRPDDVHPGRGAPRRGRPGDAAGGRPGPRARAGLRRGRLVDARAHRRVRRPGLGQPPHAARRCADRSPSVHDLHAPDGQRAWQGPSRAGPGRHDHVHGP